MSWGEKFSKTDVLEVVRGYHSTVGTRYLIDNARGCHIEEKSRPLGIGY